MIALGLLLNFLSRKFWLNSTETSTYRFCTQPCTLDDRFLLKHLVWALGLPAAHVPGMWWWGTRRDASTLLSSWNSPHLSPDECLFLWRIPVDTCCLHRTLHSSAVGQSQGMADVKAPPCLHPHPIPHPFPH